VQERTLLKPSAQLQEAAQPIWDQILRHPYLQELRSGTLPLETFRFYVQQEYDKLGSGSAGNERWLSCG